jgi:hypothetical protein
MTQPQPRPAHPLLHPPAPPSDSHPRHPKPGGPAARPRGWAPASMPLRTALPGLLPAIVAAVGAAQSAAAQSCVPSTTPCQTCALPTSCGTPPPGCFGSDNTTFSTTELACSGALDQTTTETLFTIGGAGGADTVICIGPGGTQPARICAGQQNVNTVTHTITASPVAIPTLSVWGLALVGGGLGIAAVRRLRRRHLA